MDQIELEEYLKDNLRVEINCGHKSCDEYLAYETVEISLYLGNKLISSSEDCKMI